MAGAPSPRFAAISRRAAAFPQDDEDEMTGQPNMPQPVQASEAAYVAQKPPLAAKKKISASAPPQSPGGQPKKAQTFPGAKSGTIKGYA